MGVMAVGAACCTYISGEHMAYTYVEGIFYMCTYVNICIGYTLCRCSMDVPMIYVLRYIAVMCVWTCR
jgi:hypothetical protein